MTQRKTWVDIALVLLGIVAMSVQIGTGVLIVWACWKVVNG